MENLRRTPAYDKIVSDLIKEKCEFTPLRADSVKVVCLVSDKAEVDRNYRKVYAKTEKIPDKYRLFMDADVMITVYENNVMFFSREQKRIMIYRELLKINSHTGEGEKKIGIRDFDLNDFRTVIDQYGLEWDAEKTLFSK